MIPDRIKKLITVILEAMIRDGRVGIEDGAMDRRINFVRQQFDFLENALELLIDLEDNEEDFDFEDFGQLMCDVLYCRRDNNVEDVVATIHTWLGNADCAIREDTEDMDDKRKPHFTEDEVNQLAKTIIDESNLS